MPSAPTGALEPPHGAPVTTTLAVTFDGSACSYEGPVRLDPGIVRVEFDNSSDLDGWLDVTRGGEFSVQVPTRPGTANSGYAGLGVGASYTIEYNSGSGTKVVGPTIEVGTG